MPRSRQEILDHADELADKFEQHEPDPSKFIDAAPLRALRAAVVSAADAERTVTATIEVARNAGLSWAVIGMMLGVSGEAARRKYSSKVPTP